MSELLLTLYPIRVRVRLVGDGQLNDHEALELAHKLDPNIDMANCACGTAPSEFDLEVARAIIAARRQAGTPDLG